MPTILTHKQSQELLSLQFCYLCAQPFLPDQKRNKDHVPPKSCFAKVDRNYPLILPAHEACNSRYKLLDEKIGQIIGLKYGRVPSKENQRLKFAFFPPDGRRGTHGAVLNVNVHAAIRRWIQGFHAALYREALPLDTRFAIQPPFPAMRFTPQGPEPEPVREQHLKFVETLKINRAARNLDRIVSNNGKLTYESVWDQADGGQSICIFALDLYGWKELGDIHNFVPRGCAGSYVMSSFRAPESATRGTRLHTLVPNYDGLDPFGR